MEMREQLKIDLVSVGESNAQNSSVSVEEAMSAIADKIADAIERGAIRLRFSRVTVDELNSVEDCRNGDFYVVSDSGIVLNGMDGEPMPVEKNSVLFYNGSFFEILFSLEEIIGFDPEEILKKIDAEIQARTLGDKSNANALSTHVSDRSNPHEVTAAQVGAYTKEQVDGFIRNWSGYIVVPYGQQKPEASEAQLGKIYLVQVSTDPEVRDQYEEWISDGTAWSLIGTMSIDLSSYDKIEDAVGRERELRDLIDSVAHGTNMVAFEEGQDVFMTILDYFARKPVPYAATFYSDASTTTNTLTNVPPILVTDEQTAGFKVDCFCLFDVDSPGSDDKPDYARSILLEYANNKSDAGYIKFLGRIGNSSHTRPTQPSNSYWEQFLNGKMCDGTFNYKSNKVATVKTVTDKINALDVNDAAVANQFVTAVKETDGKVSISRRQPVMADVSGLVDALEERDAKITALEGDLQDLKSKTLDMKVDSDVVEFFIMEA